MAQQQQNNKAKKYFNFGVGWLQEQFGTLNFVVDHTKNAKANKGQAYKLFLVPVDGTGDPEGDGIELKYFRVKETEKGPKAPQGAPDYQVYAVVED